MHHAVKLTNGIVIYIPSSIPHSLYRFVDGYKEECEMERFKQKVRFIKQ